MGKKLNALPKLLKYSVLFLWILASVLSPDTVLFGQSLRDTLKLKEFEVVASFPVNNIGFKKVRLDSTILIPRINADLSAILTQYSTLFIKSYGNGSLSTPSFRGTSAHHTLVEWNGIALNSPMLGQTNLAQLPVSQFDGVEILYGGSGILSAGGAFGGVINLTTHPDWENTVHVNLAQTIASFGTYSTNLNVAAGNRKFQSITKANFTSSANDFPFYDTNLDSTRYLKNASYWQAGFSEDLFFRFGKNHFLTAKAWYSRNFSEIPPPMTTLGSAPDESQENESLRSLAEYKFLQKAFNLTLRSAYVDDKLNYHDTTGDSRHHSYSALNRLRLSWTGTKKLSLKTGLDLNRDWVESDAYGELKTRILAGWFGELAYDILHNLKASVVMREDLVDGSLMPFIFAAGMEYRPVRKWNWSLSANVSRNYRMPTLNDLYWEKSGNPDLEPEQSLTVEAGTVVNAVAASGALFLEGQLTGYYSWIDDLIVWQPVAGNSFLWRPYNLKTVHARGLEAGLNVRLSLGKWEVSLTNDYNFCRSTNEDPATGQSEQAGKQLIYIPVHTFKSNLSTGWKDFYASYNFVYTSRRYTGTDNETYMPGYNLSNIFVGKNIHLKKFTLSLQLEMNNIFDLDYQSIANRPMPGRNYAVTLRGSFRK